MPPVTGTGSARAMAAAIAAPSGACPRRSRPVRAIAVPVNRVEAASVVEDGVPASSGWLAEIVTGVPASDVRGGVGHAGFDIERVEAADIFQRVQGSA